MRTFANLPTIEERNPGVTPAALR